MTAIERLLSALPEVRRVRENQYRARCPVHQGRSKTSLSITDTGDRVLVHCHAGCDYKAIASSLGLNSAAVLFDAVDSSAHIEIQRKVRIKRGLEIWCERRLVHVCQQLRDIETRIRNTAGSLSKYEDGQVPRDLVAEERLWETLGNAYHTRSEFEEQFEILNHDDPQAKYELFRRLK
jgi:hypothetical protein